MAPNRNAPTLRSSSSNRHGMSLTSIVRWSMVLASICGFAYMWSIYAEMSASQYYANVSVVKKDSLGVSPPKDKRIRGGVEKTVMKERVETVDIPTVIANNIMTFMDQKNASTTTTAAEESKDVAIIDEPRQNRLYCMVPFIWTPSAFPAYHAIRNTWGKRCHITKFFIDPVIGDRDLGFYNMTNQSEVQKAKEANLTLPDDVVVLHSMQRPWHTCADDDNKKTGKPIGNCRNIWEKIWRAWVYTVYGSTGSHATIEAGKNKNGKSDAYNAEWFVKVDADTYLFPDNLPRYVQSRGWSYDDQHYFGHVLNHRKSDRKVSIVAGAAVFFSRATLLKAAETFNTMSMERGDEEEDGTCRDAYTGTEEVVTAVCIKNYVEAEPAVDDVGREQVSLYEVELILEYNRTDQGEWWFWSGKKKVPCHDNPNDCLGHLPLAFHHLKNANDLLEMDKEFYGDGEAGRKKRQDYVNEYFNKVRSALRAAEASEADGQTIAQDQVDELGGKDDDDGDDDDASSEADQQSPQLAAPESSDNRLYCMVPFIWDPHFIPQYETIKKTWGQRCDLLKFFIDPIIGVGNNTFVDARLNETAKTSLPDDAVVVEKIKRPWNQCGKVEEGKTCRNIWEKLWRSWIVMDDTGDLDQAEWFAKIDADTYLFAENFKHYVEDKKWLPSEQHYFGHVLFHRTGKHDVDAAIVAGAAVFFSRTTLKSLVSILKGFKEGESRTGRQDCKDDYTSEEEVVTAVCIKKNFGVEAQTTLDDAGKELIAVAEPEDSLVWNRTEQGEWWYWQGKEKKDPNTGAQLHQCCGDRPIAFHGYKDPQWFVYLENQFYGANLPINPQHQWKYNWRNPDETKPYFDRVKKALGN